MQEIIEDNKQPKEVVCINECKFEDNKIYARMSFAVSRGLRVLVRFNNIYYWSGLSLSNFGAFGGSSGYSSPQAAIRDVFNQNKVGILKQKVFIFDNQCELKKWAS